MHHWHKSLFCLSVDWIVYNGYYFKPLDIIFLFLSFRVQEIKTVLKLHTNVHPSFRLTTFTISIAPLHER